MNLKDEGGKPRFAQTCTKNISTNENRRKRNPHKQLGNVWGQVDKEITKIIMNWKLAWRRGDKDGYRRRIINNV